MSSIIEPAYAMIGVRSPQISADWGSADLRRYICVYQRENYTHVDYL